MDITHNQSATSLDTLAGFGSSASFTAAYDNVTYGDNHTQRMLKGINALSMSMNVQFQSLTDIESQDIISFLQKQFFYKVPTYSKDNDTGAYSLTNQRVEPFRYSPFYPYKENNFHCLNFTHNKVNYNVNNISATLEVAAPSVLASVESGPGHNNKIDAKINASLNNVSSVSDNDVNLPSGSVIYEDNAYATAYLDQSFVVSNGNSNTLHASSSTDFSNGEVSVNQTSKRNSIYICEPNDCFYYPYKPIHKDGDLEVRMFDFRPSDATSIQHSPKYKNASFSNEYKKYHFYGLNPNLTQLSLNFEGRSNIEAKRILLFLESHLGYKKFGFHVQKDYQANSSNTTNFSPAKSKLSFFYCPSWSHTFVYHENHNISATFIECL
jgi:phage-related protein